MSEALSLVDTQQWQPPCHSPLGRANARPGPRRGVEPAFSALAPRRPRRAWLPLTIACGVAATLWAGVAPECRAQSEPAPRFPDPPAASLSPPAPAPSMLAYRFADAALRGDTPAPAPDLAGCSGVEVVLRLGGPRVARGQSMTGVGDLAAAVARAQEEFSRTVPPGRDLVEEEYRRGLLPSLVISLELAGPLIPIEPATYDEANRTLAPGLDGVAVRRGSRVDAVFPSWMMGAGLSPGAALQMAVSLSLGDSSAALPGVASGEAGATAKANGLTFYRFRVTHLAQSRERAEPQFLFRGGRLVDASSVSTPELIALEDRVADHLIARRRDEAHGKVFVGVLQLGTGAAEPAEAMERALASFALASYGRRRHDGPHAMSAGAAAEELLSSLLRVPIAASAAPRPEKLAKREVESPCWDDPAAVALTALALRDMAQWQPGRVLADPDRFARLDGLLAGYVRDGVWAPEVPASARGVVAYALAVRVQDAAGTPGEGEARTLAERGLRAVYRDTPPAKLASQMPWIAWADRALAGEGVSPAAAMLRETREQCWKLQLRDDDPDRADLQGGLSLAGSGIALPTWHTLRPGAFLVGMLGDRAMTSDAELLPELSRVLALLRFVRQLEADEAVCGAAPDVAASLHGIREATWSPRQPVEASAMTLILLGEATASIEGARERLAARRPAK